LSVAEHYYFARDHLQMELGLLRKHWRVLLLVGLFQYIHKVATNVAYYIHTPATPLRDLGFEMIPPLTIAQQKFSEWAFFTLFLYTGFFLASPFLKFMYVYHVTYTAKSLTSRSSSSQQPEKNDSSSNASFLQPLYTVTILVRAGVVLMLAQALRCICFLSTSLPGPNYHCRPGSPQYDPPTGIEILTRLDAFFGCGDLVFSSHTTFMLICALILTKYNPQIACAWWRKVLLWTYVVFFCVLVIAARKHYTLDIVVALYTVPLLWISYDHFYPDEIEEREDRHARKEAMVL